MKKNILIFFLISIYVSNSAFAQHDTIKKDSTLLYKNIELYSKRSKFNKFMYGLVFKSIATKSSKIKAKRKAYKKLIHKPYSSFEGKVIRNINIETLDPFGYSIGDTIVAPPNFISAVGNKLHVKSKHITIQNLLIIHQNQLFDSLRVKESERLVRIRGYVRDVSFYVKYTSNKSDSVDIFIRELDNWSILPKAIISTSRNTFDLTDRNFLGFGQEFQHAFTRNFSSGINSYNTSYTIPNIRNTFVSTTMHYGIDGYGNFDRILNIERPFYSPLAKWAAGAYIAYQYKKDSLKYIDSIYVPLNLKFSTQDYWVGKAIQIFKGNTEDERTTNLIVAARYYRIRYSENPVELYDPLHNYSSEDFYLAGIAISTRKYVQDKYIFKYGVVEDVPVGRVYGLTGGYQVKNNIGRTYIGMHFAYGNYNNWGYLSTNFEYGTFFHASQSEQGVISLGVNYFTGLFEIGKWKFRQFIKPQLMIGLNRTSNDSLTLKDGYGLDGFNSSALSGTNRMLLTLQTQSYAPWSFLGFNFGPYLNCSLGMLGRSDKGFGKSSIYSQIGLGVIIKNENLIINTFQFSISFYPLIPGNGKNVFKVNSFSTTDFGFRDFEIGKPAIVLFR